MPSREVVAAHAPQRYTETAEEFVLNNKEYVVHHREPQNINDLWLSDAHLDVLAEGALIEGVIPDLKGLVVAGFKEKRSASHGVHFELLDPAVLGHWYDRLQSNQIDDLRMNVINLQTQRVPTDADVVIAAGSVHSGRHWRSLVLIKTRYSARCYLIDSMGCTRDDTGYQLMRLLLDCWCCEVPDREAVTIAQNRQEDIFNCGFYSTLNSVAAFAIGCRLIPRNPSMTQYQNKGFIHRFETAIKDLRTSMTPGLREWLFHYYSEYIESSGKTTFRVGKTMKTQLEVFKMAIETATGILPVNHRRAPRAARLGDVQSYNSETGTWRIEGGDDVGFSEPVKGPVPNQIKAADHVDTTVGASKKFVGKKLGTSASNPFSLLDGDDTDEEDDDQAEDFVGEIVLDEAPVSVSSHLNYLKIDDEDDTDNAEEDIDRDDDDIDDHDDHDDAIAETKPTQTAADTTQQVGDNTDDVDICLDIDALAKEPEVEDHESGSGGDKYASEIRACYEEGAKRRFEDLYITSSFPPELLVNKEIPLTTLEYKLMAESGSMENFTLEKYQTAMLEAMPLSGLEGKDASKLSQKEMRRIQLAQKRLERRYNKLLKQYVITKDGVFENTGVLNVGKKRKKTVEKDLDKRVIPVANPTDIFYEAFKAHLDASHMASTASHRMCKWANITRAMFGFITDCCEVCRENDPSRLAEKALRNITPIISVFSGQRVECDLIDMAFLGNPELRFLLHVKDHWSRFSTLYALKSKTADEVSNLLERHILRAPTEIFLLHTDNGKEFKNEKLSNVLQNYSICQIFGAPRKPRTQGSVEITNGLIKKACKKLYPAYQDGIIKDVDLLLGRIQFAVNHHKSKGTGYRPVDLYTRRDPSVVESMKSGVECLMMLFEKSQEDHTYLEKFNDVINVILEGDDGAEANVIDATGFVREIEKMSEGLEKDQGVGGDADVGEINVEPDREIPDERMGHARSVDEANSLGPTGFCYEPEEFEKRALGTNSLYRHHMAEGNKTEANKFLSKYLFKGAMCSLRLPFQVVSGTTAKFAQAYIIDSKLRDKNEPTSIMFKVLTKLGVYSNWVDAGDLKIVRDPQRPGGWGSEFPLLQGDSLIAEKKLTSLGPLGKLLESENGMDHLISIKRHDGKVSARDLKKRKHTVEKDSGETLPRKRGPSRQCTKKAAKG